MKIGSQAHKTSAISTSNPHTILVRGRDLCEELIGHVSFTAHVWLLVTGKMPDSAQQRVLDATLVAIAEHGLVPSVQAARMTLAAAPEAVQGAVAAGLLGCGSVILGAAQDAGTLLATVVNEAGGAEPDEALEQAIRGLRDARKAIPGYGHPLHKQADPRAVRLLAVADEYGVSGPHARAALRAEHVISALTGRNLVLNVSGAIAAVLLDAGFPARALRGVPLMARTGSLIAHLLEEVDRPIGFVLSHAAAQAVGYDGNVPAGFQASED
jgi:citrate synthase